MGPLVKLFLAGAVFTTVAGCAGSSVHLTVGQALLISEAGADGVNHAATVAANSGILHGQSAAKAKAAVDTANQAVFVAHAAYLAGTPAQTASSAKAALTAIADAQAAIKGPGQ